MSLRTKQEESLDKRIGYLTFTFTSDRIQVSMPDHDVVIDGKTQHVKGIHQDVRYGVVAASPKSVSVSSVDPDTGEANVTEFNFEGRDTAWIPYHIAEFRELGSEDDGYREYFRRVK